MATVDQFESDFRAATKEIYTFKPVAIKRILVVNDCDDKNSKEFLARVKQLLTSLEDKGPIDWKVLRGEDFRTVKNLLDSIERIRPDLIVTYRHLHSDAWQWPYSLGEHLDVMTQVTTTPVLVLPHPRRDDGVLEGLKNMDRVMAAADHLTGDDRLVDYAVRFTEKSGTLFLSHIESSSSFETMMDIISKIPSIETDSARKEIRAKLLKEPRDYFESCRKNLAKSGVDIQVESMVTLGRHLIDYKKWIADHKMDLMVMNTKDEDQLAMHGETYSLVVELRDIPLLLL